MKGPQRLRKALRPTEGAFHEQQPQPRWGQKKLKCKWSGEASEMGPIAAGRPQAGHTQVATDLYIQLVKSLTYLGISQHVMEKPTKTNTFGTHTCINTRRWMLITIQAGSGPCSLWLTLIFPKPHGSKWKLQLHSFQKPRIRTCLENKFKV